MKAFESIELKKITTIEENIPDDFFICCGSPEVRCKGTLNLLDKRYKAKHVIILEYDHPNSERKANIKDMKNILRNVGKITEFQINEDKPIPIIIEIIEFIRKNSNKSLNPKINLDISTIIKWHLLLLLKALGIYNLIDKIRFLYTEPKDYIIDLFQPLSFGIKEIFSIPFYSGNYDFSKDSLLVLLLGYEGNRAMALLENLDPTDCLLLIPKPAYHEEWEGRTEKMNKAIINIVGKSKIKYLDSRNPVKVYHKLKSILSDPYYLKYNHIISPLGTKPQTLGLFYYLLNNPSDTVLIYGSPIRHNHLFYSEGIGRSWILPYFC